MRSHFNFIVTVPWFPTFNFLIIVQAKQEEGGKFQFTEAVSIDIFSGN